MSDNEDIQAIIDHLEETNPEAVLFPDFEQALIGGCDRAGQPTVAIYDYERCIEILTEDEDMTQEEALEYFEVNVACEWLGESTPCFLYRPESFS